MIRTTMAAGAAVLLCAGPAAAQADPDAAAHWRALTRMDLEAAYVLVRDNHPAAAPELKDEGFRRDLDAAIAAARARVERVEGYGGYTAVLKAFAVSLGDKHIWSRQTLRPAVYHWPGLAIARRGATWQVAVDARRDADGALKDAILIGCDGRTADALAEERLGGYRAVWAIEAQRVQTAPYLLLDDGNPFLKRPDKCEFEKEGRRREVALTWTEVGPLTLNEHFGKAINVGAAGFGVRPFAGGHWIALQSLDGRAREVVDQVKAQATTLRAAPLVVLDLRGNGGGASSFGDEIAAALMGEDYVRRVAAAAPAGDCPPLWRATPGNLAALKSFVTRNGGRLDPQSRAYWEASVKTLEEAVASGRPFDGPVVACPGVDAPEPKPADGRGSLMKGRMIVLTDAECFSSCLLVTQTFRRLGALHVGDATDAATRYMEVREAALPSGLSFASTLQKASMTSRRQIGPFVPARRFDGDMRDTAALEAWIAQIK